jgi:hypothetical protein
LRIFESSARLILRKMINIDGSIVAFEPPFVAISNRTRETCLNDQQRPWRIRQVAGPRFLLNAQADVNRLGEFIETMSVDVTPDELSREILVLLPGLRSLIALRIDRSRS